MPALTAPSTMAASILCRDLLSRPRVTLTTSYRGRAAWHLIGPSWPAGPAGRPGEGLSGLSLLTPAAVLLPQSVVVPVLPAGSPEVGIGDGALWYDDQRIAVRRWFIPAQVSRGSLRGRALSPARSGLLGGGWRAQLGLGDGLTPYGDDVICGVLLGLLAIDHEDAQRLATEIQESDLEARTTRVSAALVRCACDGWCIPEVEHLLRRVATELTVDEAVAALLAVGHSSGRGLLTGLASVIDLPPLGLAA